MSFQQKMQAVKNSLKEVWDQISLPSEDLYDNQAVQGEPSTYHDGDALVYNPKDRNKKHGQ